jgi:acetylornithine deacetylase
MEDVRRLLDLLVGMDTTSRASNLHLVAAVEDLLDEHGVPHERVPSPDGTKANLLARIGPDLPGGIVLTGHTDCVPVDGQPWTRDPFAVHEEEGRLYGRGVTDMKGFLAVVLAALPRLVAADLTHPVLLALTYDEELGTIGAPSAVARLAERYPTPAAVIVGEPTSMRVVTAHKGVRAFTTTFEGRDGHSSQPQLAANAIAALARTAAFIDDLAERQAASSRDERFAPPHTTFNLATVAGGQAINIVPRHAELTWEYRPIPADDGDDLAAEVDAFVRAEVLPRLRRDTGVGAVTTVPVAVARALAAEEGGAAERLVRALTGDTSPAGTVPFGTDGGHFQAAGWSTVVCGPGDIAQAHQPDEWVTLDQLGACVGFVDALADHLTGRAG